MQPGEKHVANTFTPEDVIMCQFLACLSFCFPRSERLSGRNGEPAERNGRLLRGTYASTVWLYLQSALWSPAECEEIGHRGRVTSRKHVISIWLLLIEDVSAVEWVMTQEPSCSATDGLQTPTTHTNTHNTRLLPFISYSYQLSSSLSLIKAT